METATHALRDRWFVSFLPLITAETVSTEFKGDWKLAAERRIQRLDWMTTVEEVWSTLNSLPRIQQLSVGSTFIMARNDKDPSFEAFPQGSRVVVNLLKAPAIEKGLDTIISVVLGETITQEVSDGKAVCDVIRISARPSREYSDLLRVEVWLNDSSYSADIVAFMKKALAEREVATQMYLINENPFESKSNKKLAHSYSVAHSSEHHSLEKKLSTREAVRPTTEKEAAAVPRSDERASRAVHAGVEMEKRFDREAAHTSHVSKEKE